MATRTLTVALRALVAGYTGPMKAAAAATTPLEASLMRLQRAGAGMAAVGATMQRRITLPLVAIGAAAVVMSNRFDQAMTKVSALTTTSADDVDRMREGVLRLAGETAKSPVELAEALFVVASNGIQGAAAMELLEASAKASAAGLGETKDIARVAASAVNAFGIENLSTSHAVDVLVATAQAGNFEVSELASSLGRVLPTARDAGVSFEDVGGAIALLTKSGIPASQAVTRLDGLLRAVSRPTQQARDMMEELGFTIDDVRASMDERGLVTTLEMLDAGLEDAGFNMDQFLRRSEAQAAASDILNASNEELAETFGITADAAGSTESAFAELAATAGFQSQQAFTDMQVALIDLGDNLAPVAAEVLGFVGDVVSGFKELPDAAKIAVVAFGGIVAAIGPLMRIGGSVAELLGRIGLKAAAAGLQASALGLALGGVGLVATLGIAAIAMQGYARRQQEASETVDEFLRALELQNEGVERAVEIAAGARIETGRWSDELKNAGVDIEVLAGSVEHNSDAARELMDILRESGNTHIPGFGGALEDAANDGNVLAQELLKLDENSAGFNEKVLNTLSHLDELGGHLDTAGDKSAETADEQDALAEAAAEAGLAFDEQGNLIDIATAAMQEYLDTLRATVDPLFALDKAQRDNAAAQADVTEKQRALNEAIEEHGENSAEAAAAQQDYDAAVSRVGETALDVTGAAALLNDEIRKNPALLDDAIDRLGIWQDQGLLTEEQALLLAAQFMDTAEQAKVLDETDPHLSVTEDGMDEVRGKAETLFEKITGIPVEWGTDVSEVGMDEVMAQAAALTEMITGIPVTWHTDTSEDGMDHVREQAFDLTEMITGIPVTWHTDTTEDGMSHVRDQAFNLTRQIMGIPPSSHTEARATDNATSVFNWVSERLRALDGSTATVRINATGDARDLVGRQHGGPVWPGQPFLVGEAGPELVTFGQRGHVFSNPQTMSMARHLSPVGGGGVSEIKLTGTATVRAGEPLVAQIHRAARTGELQLQVDGRRVRVG